MSLIVQDKVLPLVLKSTDSLPVYYLKVCNMTAQLLLYAKLLAMSYNNYDSKPKVVHQANGAIYIYTLW